jgi:hypothetical protein
MRAWGAGVSAGYAVLGVSAALLHIPGSGLVFGLCAALTLALSLIAAPLLEPRRRDDGDGGVSPPAEPDYSPPPWWPEFEREFRGYAERLTSVRR